MPVYSRNIITRFAGSLFLLLVSFLGHIETKALGVQIQLVSAARFLQDGRNVPSVLDSPEVHVTSALLDRVANKLR